LNTIRPLIAVLLLTSACAPTLPRFQAGKAVEIAPAPIGNSYKQDGKPVDLSSLIDGLEAQEPTRAEAGSARSFLLGGQILGGLGGAGLGFGVVYGLKGQKVGWAIAGGGAALAAVGFVLGSTADGHLTTATGIYNKALSPRASAPVPTPWLAPAADANGKACGVQGGISLRF
jgi:hypothetical protein